MVDRGTQTLAEMNGQERKKCSRDRRGKCLKLRILLADPDATDSSSDDECEMNFTRKKLNEGVKRLLAEVVLNIPACNSEEKAKLLTTSPKRKSFSQYKGVRLRQSGNWAAEISDPIKGGRIWLGTFKTELEAAQAYQKKKLEFDSLKLCENNYCSSTHCTAPVSQHQPCASEETDVIGSNDSPSSVLETANVPMADDVVRSQAPMKGKMPSVSRKPVDHIVKSRAPAKGKTLSVSGKPVDHIVKSRAPAKGKTLSVSGKPVDDVAKSRVPSKGKLPSVSVKPVNDAVKSLEPMETTVPPVSVKPMDDVIKSQEPTKPLMEDLKARASAAASCSTGNNFNFDFSELRPEDLPLCHLEDFKESDDFDLDDLADLFDFGDEVFGHFGNEEDFGDFGGEEDLALPDTLKVGFV
ncbi:hypothetical protein Droror1_Dr00006188 [Drosera rotundifolia]